MDDLQDLMANGAGFSAPEASKGFDAGDLWDGHYTFKKAHVDAEGATPMPNQSKIDRFQREMSRHFLELDAAQRKENKAREELGDAADERSVEESLAEVDKALEFKREVMVKLAKTTAELCSNKPTAKQLEKLPENVLIGYINHLSGQLDPNV